MKHIMLDLETLGTGNSAAIVAIGAVRFDPYGEPPPFGEEDSFFQSVSAESAVAVGGIIDAHTVLWWMQQSDDARRKTFRQDGCALQEALVAFGEWCALGDDGTGKYPPDQIAMWGNGATFDNVIIRSAFKSVGLTPPWSFRDDRCYRTVVSLIPPARRPHLVFEGIPHHAVDDALYQAQYLQACYKILGLVQS